MFRRITRALKYSRRFDMPPSHRFVRCTSSALFPGLSRPLQELPDYRSRPKRRGTVHVVTPVGHFFADQRDFLEIGAVALRAGQVHLVTPCSPTSVWEESLSAQLPLSLS